MKKEFVIPEGNTNARIAILIDHFHLTPSEIAKLTDYQIQNLYFHKRNEKGEIEMPQAQRTEYEDLQLGLRMLWKMEPGMKPDDFKKAEAKILEKIRKYEEEHSEEFR